MRKLSSCIGAEVFERQESFVWCVKLGKLSDGASRAQGAIPVGVLEGES